MICRTVCFALLTVACGSTAARDFGPEWTRKGDTYYRTVEVPVSHHAQGNVSAYHLKLENGSEVFISERDDNQEFRIGSQRIGNIDVRKADDGSVSRFFVTLGEIRYGDLNGDGVIDSMLDMRKPRDNRHFILLGGSFLEVRKDRFGIRSDSAWSLDMETEYAFKNGRWRVKESGEPSDAPKDDQQEAAAPAVPPMQPTNASIALPEPGPPTGSIPPSAPVGAEEKRSEPSELEPPTGKERERLRGQWGELFAPVVVDDGLFAHLSLVRPQPESKFVEFNGKKLSPGLVRKSRRLMRPFFQDRVNPYANMVADTPEAVLPSQVKAREERLAGNPFGAHDEWQSLVREARTKAPYVSRARPTKYYLAPKDGLSLLLYEYDSGDYHFQIQESSAAVLMRITPKAPFDPKKGISSPAMQEILDTVFHARREVTSYGTVGRRPDPFILPQRLRPGAVFWNTQSPNLDDYLQQRSHSPPDWTAETVGFVTRSDVCLVLRKASITLDAAAPPQPGDWADPDPQWLRHDLYRNDGKTLVIDNKP